MTWGRSTTIKFYGGYITYRELGTNLVQFRQKLVATKRRMLNLSPPFQRFRDRWFEQNRLVFASGGLPTAWPGLSPAYQAWKSMRHPGKTLLRLTDRLYKGLTEGSPDTIWEVTPRTIRFGSRTPWMVFHQTGTATMPRRAALVLLPETFSELNQDVMLYVTEDLRLG